MNVALRKPVLYGFIWSCILNGCSQTTSAPGKSSPHHSTVATGSEPDADSLSPSDVRVRTVTDYDGKSEPIVTVNFPNLYPLKDGVTAIEPELKSGKWLVLVYSVNNIQHVQVSNDSPRVAEAVRGEFRVAIRPTNGYDDLKDWLPEDIEPKISHSGIPLWVILEDGKLVRWTERALVLDEILQFARNKNH